MELAGLRRHPVLITLAPMFPRHAPIRPMSLFLLAGSLVAQDPTTPSRREALERASRELTAPPPGSAGQSTGALGAQAGPVRLTDVSLDILGAVGASTASDAELLDLKGGGHDPKKRGFTLQQAELSLAGAVDPWFKAQAHLVTFLDPVDGETIVELEEAYLTTLALPAGLQVKAGTFLTEFGRINPTHPHAWDWQDQPIICTRLLGADGMRGPGARVAWLAPTDAFTEVFFGVQNANGETMTSFLANEAVYEERPIGGRFFVQREVSSWNDLVYTLRAMTSFDPSDTHSVGIGASALFGPNATGGGADTTIYGADFVWRWKPVENERGYPFFKLQGEFLARAFDTAQQVDEVDPLVVGDEVTLPGVTLHDYGGYLQALYGFLPGWAIGLRGEWVSGEGDSYDASSQSFARSNDPYRTDRVRFSPMLAWQLSEFSRFRLQYDFEDSDHLADPVHSAWLGFEVLIGSHPPHAY
jgi:hypothetical protein